MLTGVNQHSIIFFTVTVATIRRAQHNVNFCGSSVSFIAELMGSTTLLNLKGQLHVFLSCFSLYLWSTWDSEGPLWPRACPWPTLSLCLQAELSPVGAHVLRKIRRLPRINTINQFLFQLCIIMATWFDKVCSLIEKVVRFLFYLPVYFLIGFSFNCPLFHNFVVVVFFYIN